MKKNVKLRRRQALPVLEMAAAHKAAISRYMSNYQTLNEKYILNLSWSHNLSHSLNQTSFKYYLYQQGRFDIQNIVERKCS